MYMTATALSASTGDEQFVIRQLRDGNGHTPLPDAFVAAMSGDHEFTSEQLAHAERLQQERGGELFSQLLFAVTHQHVPERDAEARWRDILRHKYEMSEKLGRNVGIVVAALDYLANLRHDIDAPVIISRPSMDAIVRMAVEDPLTHVANRSAVMVKLEDEILRFDRHRTPCSLLMTDLDDFSRINDTQGHDAGDAAIREFASALVESLRGVDLCGRFGGDEFMALLPDTDAPEAALVADRILCRVRGIGLTCSIGIASCPEHGSGVADILSASDQAMLAAKRGGKNRAVTFGMPDGGAVPCPRKSRPQAGCTGAGSAGGVGQSFQFML